MCECSQRSLWSCKAPPPRSLRSVLLMWGGKVTHCHNPATPTTHVALAQVQETVGYGTLLPPPVPRSCYCLAGGPLVPQVAVSSRHHCHCHYHAKSHRPSRLALSQCSARIAPLSPSTEACPGLSAINYPLFDRKYRGSDCQKREKKVENNSNYVLNLSMRKSFESPGSCIYTLARA